MPTEHPWRLSLRCISHAIQKNMPYEKFYRFYDAVMGDRRKGLCHRTDHKTFISSVRSDNKCRDA